MARSLSSSKRQRQNVTRRARNRARLGALRGTVRKVTDALRSHKPEDAAKAMPAVMKKLDQTAAKGTIHRKTASRMKSRLAKRINKAGTTQPS